MPGCFSEDRLAALHEGPEPLGPGLGRSASCKRGFWRSVCRRWGALDPGASDLDDSFPARVTPRPLASRRPAEPYRVPWLDPRPDRLLDILHAAPGGEAPEQAGVIRAIRPMPEEDYPVELDRQLDLREPQFILRNTPRAERLEETALPFDRSSAGGWTWRELLAEMSSGRYEPPNLGTDAGSAQAAEYRRDMRQLFFLNDWTRYFGREIKENHRGPMWAYDPDQPE